jgi:hypothetical protein
MAECCTDTGDVRTVRQCRRRRERPGRGTCNPAAGSDGVRELRRRAEMTRGADATNRTRCTAPPANARGTQRANSRPANARRARGATCRRGCAPGGPAPPGSRSRARFRHEQRNREQKSRGKADAGRPGNTLAHHRPPCKHPVPMIYKV